MAHDVQRSARNDVAAHSHPRLGEQSARGGLSKQLPRSDQNVSAEVGMRKTNRNQCTLLAEDIPDGLPDSLDLAIGQTGRKRQGHGSLANPIGVQIVLGAIAELLPVIPVKVQGPIMDTGSDAALVEKSHHLIDRKSTRLNSS